MAQTVRSPLPGKPPARRLGFRLAVRSACLAVAIALAALPAEGQKITEVVFDHAGSPGSPDDHEFIEVAANPALVNPPGTGPLFEDPPAVSLSEFSIVELDGTVDGDPGRILNVFQAGTANRAGFWSTGFMTSTLERSTFTLLLVRGFTGSVGLDLDGTNDGGLDLEPWTEIADGVAFTDGSAGALTYAAPVLGPGFGGVAGAPGGASRFPYYGDSNTATDWKRNDFDGEGLPFFTGTLAAGEARNTPGSVNRVSLADFYAGVDVTSPAGLRSTLHARIENHIRFSYSYEASDTDTWDILNLADQDPNDPSKVLDIYKNESYTKIWGGQGAYNREHSWPNSYGFNDAEATSEYTDCHHLFASNVSYNSDRGNKPFGACNAGCTRRPTVSNNGSGGVSGPYPSDSNWFSIASNVWETWSKRKGDIARAQLYMDVRYEGGSHPYTGAPETDLVLTDNASLIQTSQSHMGYLSDLLQWHFEDPVDAAEMARNDVVESYQGNRNPFVDHPEWVACVFQGSCSGNPSVLFAGIVSATDPDLCAAGGVGVTWSAPLLWNDDCTSDCDRGFRVLRDGVAITTGGCAGPLAANATSCSDATGVPGVTFAYAVEAFNHEGETSTGSGSKSVADRTDDGLPPVFASGPSASSAVPTSFAVTWTTDEPSDSRLEYGPTASYGSPAYDATLVTTHSLTVTGLSASTEYHFRAGSTDACGNGPVWSSDGTVTTATVSTTLDVGGYTLVQTTSAKTYAIPTGTTVPAGGYVVIARNAERAAFETYWGVTLGPNVVFLNASSPNGETAPAINGEETFALKDAGGTVIDGPTIAMAPGGEQSIRRNDPCLPAASLGSWAVGLETSATPGSGAGAGCGTGVVVNEFSDARRAGVTSPYFYSFVELHWDSPAPPPAPSVTTGAATDVTTTGATLNGTVNPNGVATTASFAWGTTTSYGETTAGQAVGSGTAAQAVSAALTGLVPCTTYHYRVKATSAGGTATSEDASFQTTCIGGHFFPLTPCRVLDTRNEGSPMLDGVPRDVAFHESCGIPTVARSLAANVTVTLPTLPGHVSIYPADVASTGTSVVHFAAGRTRASSTMIKLSNDGTGRARLEATVPTGGAAHVIVDVNGYFD